MGYVVVGVMLVMLAALAAFMVVMDRRSIQRMAATETVTAADLAALCDAAVGAGGEGSFAYTAEIKGAVRFGPEGPLTSHLTKTQCVWHRHKIERVYRERRGQRSHKKTETLVSSASEDLFYVEDATGTVLVRPTVMVDKPRKVVDEFREPRPGGGLTSGSSALSALGDVVMGRGDREDTLGFRSREWVLEEGTSVYVLGEATDLDGRVIIIYPNGSRPLVISTRTENAVSSQHARKGVVNILVGLAFLIGGVALIVLGATTGS